MIECPTADALQILANLAMQSAAVRARLREFLDANPVIASFEIDSLATAQVGHVVYRDKPSQELLDALAKALKSSRL